MKKSVATLTVTVDHILERLGARASLDPDGIDLLHEANNLKTILLGFGRAAPTRPELVMLVDRVARLDMRAKALMDARLGRLAERLPASMRPTPTTQAQMHEALEGPKAITLVECPKCGGCTLCAGARMVTPAIAADYELKNVPRRERATMAPPKKPKGE